VTIDSLPQCPAALTVLVRPEDQRARTLTSMRVTAPPTASRTELYVTTSVLRRADHRSNETAAEDDLGNARTRPQDTLCLSLVILLAPSYIEDAELGAWLTADGDQRSKRITTNGIFTASFIEVVLSSHPE
jgi:hypothetical protein